MEPMRFFPLIFFLTAFVPGVMYGQESVKSVRVEIRTELGIILMELYPTRAPKTVANFLEYVDGAFFDGGTFHRTVHDGNQPNDSVRIAVIQGDVSPSRRDERAGPIPLERTSETGLRHLDGTVSMARSGPDTATSSFFICIGEQPELDFGGRRNPDGQGFAAFGKILQGMEVVRAINRSPAEGQTLSPSIRILQAKRVES
jgi:peptidyl-prolyl cis-trans isomerase A (cyclophilin A)